MRQTRRLFIASLLALLLLSANGVFFILQTGIGSLHYVPEPFSGESGSGYETKSLPRRKITHGPGRRRKQKTGWRL